MSDENLNKANEPSAAYQSDKKITFFNSFEEQENYHLQKMANRSHGECIKLLEQLRRIVYKDNLLPDGSWKPIEKVITIREPFK